MSCIFGNFSRAELPGHRVAALHVACILEQTVEGGMYLRLARCVFKMSVHVRRCPQASGAVQK